MRLAKAKQAAGMKLAIVFAEHLETQSSHIFFTGTRTNKRSSPKLSQFGQYYFDCLNCGRSIFDDGKGSATASLSCR